MCGATFNVFLEIINNKRKRNSHWCMKIMYFLPSLPDAVAEEVLDRKENSVEPDLLLMQILAPEWKENLSTMQLLSTALR